MLKERARIVAGGLFIVDLLLVTFAFFLSFWLRSSVVPAVGLIPSHLYPLRLYLPLLPIALLIWSALLLRFNLYHSQRTTSLLAETWDIVRVCITGTLLLALVIYLWRLDQKLLGNDLISRLWILLFVTTTFLLLAGRMILVRISARWVRVHGYNYRTLLIAGTNETARKIARSIEAHPHWGYRIVGFVSERGEAPRADIAGHPHLGQIEEIPAIVEEKVVDEVIFALHRQELHRLESLLLQLEEQGIRTRLALDLFPHAKARVQVGTLEELESAK